MRKILVSLFFVVFLLAGCGLPVIPATPPGGDSVAATGSPSPSFPEATATSTATPTPSPTETPTPTPISKVYGVENFSSFVVLQAYWEVVENEIYEQFGLEAGSNRIDAWAYSPDGRYVAIGGCTTISNATCYKELMSTGNSFVYILDALTSEVVASIPENNAEISGLAFSPDGERLVYAICPQKVLVWNMEQGETERELWRGSGGCSSHPKVAVSPDGGQAALVVGTSLLVFDIATGEQLAQAPATRYGSVLPKYSGDGGRLAVFAAEDGREIAIYDTETWQAISRFKVSETAVDFQAVDFSRDGRWVVTADAAQDGILFLWDASTGEQVAALDEPLLWPEALAFSPDGLLLLAAGLPIDNPEDGNVSVWELTSLQRIGSFGNFDFADRIQFAADGESFVISGSERWSLPDAVMLAAQQAVIDFLMALHAGDFEAAADLFEPGDYELDAIRALGLDPDDLPGTLEAICSQESQPCMPMEEVLSSAKWGASEYEFTVSFTAPDGSTFLDTDGYAESYIYVARLPGGDYRVTILPYFFLNP